MGFLSNLLDTAKRELSSYTGDKVFLAAVASAAANVTAADGKIEDSELETAILGMKANPIIKASYSGSQIEEALTSALSRAKSRAGRMENKRLIEALVTRPPEQRQDVFLIAADIADNDGIAPEEQRVLDEVANLLNVDGKKLLG